MFGGRDITRDGSTERQLSWLAGTSAIVVPLLAYLAVVGHVRGSLTGLLTDTGQTAGSGLGAHLRLVLLLPLFLTFVTASPRPTAELRGRSARSRALKADMIALSVRDKDLDDTYLDHLRRHLAAASPDDQARYACKLAERLGRSYSAPQRPRSTPPAHGPRAAPGYPRRESVTFALDIARRRLDGQMPPTRDQARARSLVTRTLPAPPPDIRAAVRAHDTIQILHCRLADGESMFGHCLDALVAASRHEVEDAAEPYLTGPTAGVQYTRNLEKARKEIDAQLATLTNFEFYEGMSELAWLAPVMALNDPPGVRTGGPAGQHPYRHIAAGLLIFGLLAAVAYVSFAGVPK